MTKLAALLTLGLIANEIRGILMAGPVFWAIWETGGSVVQWTVLGALLLSVIVPVWIIQKMRRK